VNHLSCKLTEEIKFHTVISSQVQYSVLHMLKSWLAFRKKERDVLNFEQHTFFLNVFLKSWAMLQLHWGFESS